MVHLVGSAAIWKHSRRIEVFRVTLVLVLPVKCAAFGDLVAFMASLFGVATRRLVTRNW